MKIVILAGGSGTRLWPFSRKEFPKQFMHFGDRYSLLQKTVERFLGSYPPQDILIMTNQDYYHLVKTQVCELSPQLATQIIVEPERKNTAPAIALAVSFMQEKLNLSTEECFLVCSSDHFISPKEEFIEAVTEAEKIAKSGKTVIFGVRPNHPETGYGYIKTSPVEQNGGFAVDAFVEKPSYSQAQQYLLSGNFLWNSGIFLFQIATFLSELHTHAPQIALYGTGSFDDLIFNFSKLPDISVDYAIMEHSTQTVAIPLKLNWSDVGSWDSVYDVMEKDINQNVKIGNILEIDTKSCLIMGKNRLISTIGLEDLLVIETEDALFIGKKGESQRVKALVEELKKRKAKESDTHLFSHRPWGKFTILEEGERYKIKRIVVEPQQTLSLQKHYHRSEHWIVVKGVAKATIGEEERVVHENESIYVPKGSVHRLENPGKLRLELIEVQVGEYVGEDDIIRFEDLYGRLPE